ncbi:type VI secretion system tube protein Hcp [Roseibacillus persicicus]|uniref:Uncharacterized protein n=1 Tax=Roseibacillus persicicus TaxID=454148 RepID=A0A918TWL4_9BACT|nr:type VI secretion system tube protein Hcp [Roseibacillus persicicus]GHC65531.1 hypothetical protein GCM10007100_36650 [Roseibacillus persicicus]
MKLASFLRACVVWLVLAQFSSATRIYMKIGDIKGEAMHPDYPSWIAVDTLEFSGAFFNGTAGSFTLVKSPDRSSPKLVRALEGKRYLKRVTVAFLKGAPNDATGEGLEFARLLFRDVVVEACEQETATGESGEPVCLEKFQLSFCAVLFRYESDLGDAEATYADLDNGVDSDSDGMTDRFEDFFGLDKTSDDADLDSDGDGLTHLDEFRLGLNPRLSSSSFVPVGDSDPQEPGRFRLTWATKPAKSYDIYATPDLTKEPVFLRRVQASELDTSVSFLREQARGFFSIREVVER